MKSSDKKVISKVNIARFITVEREKIKTIIEFVTEETVGLKDLFVVELESSGKKHAFMVYELAVGVSNKTEAVEYKVQAVEIGYYQSMIDRIENFDLKDLLHESVYHVTDKDECYAWHQKRLSH